MARCGCRVAVAGPGAGEAAVTAAVGLAGAEEGAADAGVGAAAGARMRASRIRAFRVRAARPGAMAGYRSDMPERKEIIEVAGRAVPVSNPGKIYFPRTGHTKLDLVRYYLSVADGALRGVAGRPMVLKRFVNGAEGEAFFQKRAPSSRPDWIETVELSFPSGRTAEEVVVRDAAGLVWVANLGLLHPYPHPAPAHHP